MDKSFWREIAGNNWDIPDGHDLNTLTSKLLGYLGTTDHELRDIIGYTTLTRWIVGGKYTEDEMLDMRDKLVDNLKVGLGETGTDSVFLRSFSALMLGSLVYRDVSMPFFTEDEIQMLIDTALDYLAKEIDVRGYAGDDKGWAHSAAHTSDLLKFLCRNPKTTAADHSRILMAIADKLTAEIDHVYAHSEDDRLSLVVVDVMKRNLLDFDAYDTWLTRCEAVMERAKPGQPFKIEVYNAYQNTKHFLRSLYFWLGMGLEEHPPVWEQLRPRLFKAISEVGL